MKLLDKKCAIKLIKHVVNARVIAATGIAGSSLMKPNRAWTWLAEALLQKLTHKQQRMHYIDAVALMG